MIPRRVAVTGLGLVTPIGLGTVHNWKKLTAGLCAINELTDEKYKELPCRIAGQIPHGNGPNKLNICEHFSSSESRTISLSTAYALLAAKEAIEDSKIVSCSSSRHNIGNSRNGMTNSEHFQSDLKTNFNSISSENNVKSNTVNEANFSYDLDRIGVSVGLGMVDIDEIVLSGQSLEEKYRKLSPHFIPKILINTPAGKISMEYGFRGPNFAVSTACATGGHAIGEAYRAIKYNDADVMICGGAEASITKLGMAGFCRLRALSTSFNNTPELASRPFDSSRDGFVMGEGSGILVLENFETAVKRRTRIYGEVLGYGMSSDAFHITSPRSDGYGAKKAMENAIKEAKIDVKDVGYINAHATSTPKGDEIEVQAIKNLFKEHAYDLAVSSTKGSIGHLLGAAGSVEAIFTILACHSGLIPPTLNLIKTSEGLDLNFVPLRSKPWLQERNIRIGLSNSFGFGGTNTSLCFSSCDYL